MLNWFAWRGDPAKYLKRSLGAAEVPPFPNVVMKALQLLRDPESSTSQISEQISLDPGISIKLLSVANSAAFALQHEVSTVRHTVSLLGRSSIETILLGLAVNQTLAQAKFKAISSIDFWTVSAERALIARSVAKIIHPMTSNESFTGGLLQDLAIPLLCREKGSDYESLIAQWWNDGGDLAEMEQRAFGWNHAHIAGWLCKTWKLPEKLSDAIGCHHQASENVPAAVTVVGALGSGPKADTHARLVEGLRELGIEPDRGQELIARAQEEAAEMAHLFTA